MLSTDETNDETRDDALDADAQPVADQVSEEIVVASPPCESQGTIGTASTITVGEKVRC